MRLWFLNTKSSSLYFEAGDNSRLLRWTSSSTMGESTRGDKVWEVGIDVADEAELYPEDG